MSRFRKQFFCSRVPVGRVGESVAFTPVDAPPTGIFCSRVPVGRVMENVAFTPIAARPTGPRLQEPR